MKVTIHLDEALEIAEALHDRLGGCYPNPDDDSMIEYYSGCKNGEEILDRMREDREEMLKLIRKWERRVEHLRSIR